MGLMPEVIHCKICGKAFRAKNFEDGMAKLRRHRKKYHYSSFRKSVKKAVATRKKR